METKKDKDLTSKELEALEREKKYLNNILDRRNQKRFMKKIKLLV